jgi:SAM-dependent methyltransferase
MRQIGGGKCAAVPQILGGATDKTVLDATCGLGRRTLLLHDLGLKVMGSDACAYAVEKARELAASEDRSVEFFVAEWRALPDRIPHKFDAVYVDAFADCCETYEDLLASFRGVAGVLQPGGVFIFSGPELGEKAGVDVPWNACDPFYVEWQHTEEQCECTCLHARFRGQDFIDDHHLYLIREAHGPVRLEHATIRQWFRWDRNRVDEAAYAAGFTGAHTRSFENYERPGTTFTRIVARKQGS